MKTIDEQTLQKQDYKLKSRKNDLLLFENFFDKIVLNPIEYKKYEMVLYGSKKYEQGRLF